METTALGRTEGHTLKGSFILEVLFCEGFKHDTGHLGLVGSTLVGLHQGLVTWGI